MPVWPQLSPTLVGPAVPFLGPGSLPVLVFYTAQACLPCSGRLGWRLRLTAQHSTGHVSPPLLPWVLIGSKLVLRTSAQRIGYAATTVSYMSQAWCRTSYNAPMTQIPYIFLCKVDADV